MIMRQSASWLTTACPLGHLPLLRPHRLRQNALAQKSPVLLNRKFSMWKLLAVTCCTWALLQRDSKLLTARFLLFAGAHESGLQWL